MLCAVFSHYTPGQSWPENRTFVAAAVVGFFISQVLHMLLFTLREGLYFLETGPKQQAKEAKGRAKEGQAKEKHEPVSKEGAGAATRDEGAGKVGTAPIEIEAAHARRWNPVLDWFLA